jgi:bifunctional DNA-binding transcriptional regulator/antitoxin component of YhaV-PrlF toxin-antitoxin module
MDFDTPFSPPKRYSAKVTGRHAITLPANLCRELGIEVGDTVELEMGYGQAFLRPASYDPVDSLSGILKDIFPDWELVERFIDEEREGWDEREAEIEALDFRG